VSWWRKDIPALKDAYSELKRPKVGRIARLSGKAEKVEAALQSIETGRPAAK
jgi:hypothetical protein